MVSSGDKLNLIIATTEHHRPETEIDLDPIGATLQTGRKVLVEKGLQGLGNLLPCALALIEIDPPSLIETDPLSL